MMNEVTCKRRSGNRLSWLIPSVLLVACIVFLSMPVYAAVFNIASGDVAGLISAINTANSNGQDNTINLAAGTYVLTAVNNDTDNGNGLPSITGTIAIDGVGADTTIIERDTNAPLFRIFDVTATGTLSLDGLTITGGSMPLNGGGILNNGGTLSINSSTISGNSTHNLGGGIYNNGKVTINNTTIAGNFGIDSSCPGIANLGTITINKSIIKRNVAEFGGAICNDSVMTINHSTISSNGNQFGGPGIDNEGDLTITDTTISANLSEGSPITNAMAGGIDNEGNLTITNCTIANNFAFAGPGAILNGGTISITNSTIANNTASPSGSNPFNVVGGILNGPSDTVHLQNTILAGNTTLVDDNSQNSDCSGQVTSLGNNIIGDTTSCTITLQSSDLTGDPGLDTFTDNGKPGNGHFPLLPSSQAINAGNNNVCLSNPILHTDQIGDPRVGICDIGSIEFEPFKNLGDCITTLIQQNCSGLKGQSRAACNKEQQTVCSNLFKDK